MFFSFSVLRISIFAQFKVALSNLLFCIIFWFENMVFPYIMMHQCHHSACMEESKGRGFTRVSLYIWYLYRTQGYSNGAKGVKIERVHYLSSYVTSKIIVVTYEILLRSIHQNESFSSLLYLTATLKYWLRNTE